VDARRFRGKVALVEEGEGLVHTVIADGVPLPARTAPVPAGTVAVVEGPGVLRALRDGALTDESWGPTKRFLVGIAHTLARDHATAHPDLDWSRRYALAPGGDGRGRRLPGAQLRGRTRGRGLRRQLADRAARTLAVPRGGEAGRLGADGGASPRPPDDAGAILARVERLAQALARRADRHRG
jgi:hypothetical protein